MACRSVRSGEIAERQARVQSNIQVKGTWRRDTTQPTKQCQRASVLRSAGESGGEKGLRMVVTWFQNDGAAPGIQR